MPVTFWTMSIGFAALAGVIPTVGFFTKDSVLAALEHGHDEGPLPGGVAVTVLGVALLTSFVTAAYATRLWLLTFLAPAPENRADAHEAPHAMTGPVVVLAVATFALSIGQPFHLGIGLLSTAIAVGGIGFVLVVWRRGRSLDLPAPWLVAELGLDRPYASWIPAAMRSSARAVVDVDRDGIDAYSRGSAGAAHLVSRVLGLVQSGNVQRYATVIAAGVIVLTAAAVVWS
jgi:NADH-quinone oxidoreductase subunit L